MKQAVPMAHSQFLMKAPLSELLDNPLAIYGNIQ